MTTRLSSLWGDGRRVTTWGYNNTLRGTESNLSPLVDALARRQAVLWRMVGRSLLEELANRHHSGSTRHRPRREAMPTRAWVTNGHWWHCQPRSPGTFDDSGTNAHERPLASLVQ